MKTKDLIEKLKTFDKDLDVCYWDKENEETVSIQGFEDDKYWSDKGILMIK